MGCGGNFIFAVIMAREGVEEEEDGVRVGGGGGKGQMSGMKWMASIVRVSDPGVGAMNTPTSDGCTRYPGGFNVVINLLLVLLSPSTSAMRWGERDVDRDRE